MTKNLPDSLYAAYEWIDSAGEWPEALDNPEKYAKKAVANALDNDVLDVTEADLDEVIAWVRAHPQAFGRAPRGLERRC